MGSVVQRYLHKRIALCLSGMGFENEREVEVEGGGGGEEGGKLGQTGQLVDRVFGSVVSAD